MYYQLEAGPEPIRDKKSATLAGELRLRQPESYIDTINIVLFVKIRPRQAWGKGNATLTGELGLRQSESYIDTINIVQ